MIKSSEIWVLCLSMTTGNDIYFTEKNSSDNTRMCSFEGYCQRELECTLRFLV